MGEPIAQCHNSKGWSTRWADSHREACGSVARLWACGLRCESGRQGRCMPYRRGDARWCDCLNVDDGWGWAGAAEDAAGVGRGERGVRGVKGEESENSREDC